MSYRWQQRQDPPSHADDWLMTYADTITLLLCFFVIFLIVTISKKDPPHQAMQQAAIETPAPPRPDIQAPPLPDPNNLPFHKLEPSDFHADAPLEPEPKPEPPVVVTPLEEPPAIKAEMPPPPPPPVEQKPQGDRITVLEMNSATFFDSGSAVLNASGNSILKDVAAKLKADQYRDYQITVEGHTDDSPVHTLQFPSNWELSTARASAVVHYFLDQGIPAQRLRAAGYADTFPKAPNRDAKGAAIPTNQAQNRRVVIKLEKIDKAEE